MERVLFSYNSVLMLVQAVSLFTLFTRFEIRRTYIKKIILFFSTSTLGIYLGQDLFLWSKLNFYDTNYPLALYLPSIFLTSAIIMVLAEVIDKIRARLFKLFAVDRLCQKMAALARKLIWSLK